MLYIDHHLELNFLMAQLLQVDPLQLAITQMVQKVLVQVLRQEFIPMQLTVQAVVLGHYRLLQEQLSHQ